MNQVVSVELENNPQYGVVVSSRKVAQGLNKRHDHVMRDLDNILHSSNVRNDHSPDLGSEIIPVKYTAKNNQQYREYLLTKDGFTLYMFNIQGYNDFKWAYIQKFNEMEAALANVSKPVQQQLPLEDKPKRKTWNGNPVMTVEDLAALMHCTRDIVHFWVKKYNVVYTILEGRNLAEYKRENKLQSSSKRLMVFPGVSVETLLKSNGIYKEHADFLHEYFRPEHALSNEDMRFAVKQADLLLCIARDIKDPVVKEMNLKAVTALLINIGLWNDKHAGFNGVSAEWDINSLEGWNKLGVFHDAQRYWKW